MSDISLNLNGVIAFLLAAGLSVFLVLGIAVCALLAATSAQANGGRVGGQPAFAHLRGMACCLPGFIAVAAFIFANDSTSQADGAKTWLDNYALLWTVIFLAPWPVSVFMTKRRR